MARSCTPAPPERETEPASGRLHPGGGLGGRLVGDQARRAERQALDEEDPDWRRSRWPGPRPPSATVGPEDRQRQRREGEQGQVLGGPGDRQADAPPGDRYEARHERQRRREAHREADALQDPDRHEGRGWSRPARHPAGARSTTRGRRRAPRRGTAGPRRTGREATRRRRRRGYPGRAPPTRR